MVEFDRVALAIVLICTGLKVLLIPAYRSTDFEVHRNWLAITHSKPLEQWYSDVASTSPWTLDYPPLFAWFEWALSQAAPYFDPDMLKVDNLDYASSATIRFQRLSVILTEGLLLGAAWLATRSLPQPRRRLALFLIAANPGLIIVDHIHFQYNGVLLGLFVLSIWSVAAGDAHVLGAALFTILLCSKHIFLYSAPPFFVYLLRYYCRGPGGILRFLLLGCIVLGIIAGAFAPFIAAGQGPQLLSRLFPVSRGLLHAYWAPNFWALYAAADKIFAATIARIAPALLTFGWRIQREAPSLATLTGGLVGEASFAVLPNVGSRTAAVCTVIAMAPALATCWQRPLPGRFARCVVYCTLCSFIFGFHVHEKAILMVLIPLALLAAGGKDADAPREYILLSTLGTYSLFPLLTRIEEYEVKILLLGIYLLIALPWLRDPEYWTSSLLFMLPKASKDGFVYTQQNREQGRPEREESTQQLERNWGKRRREKRSRPNVLSHLETFYLWGLVPLEMFCSLGHTVIFNGTLPFLPLLLISVYCGTGIVYCWGRMAAGYLSELGVLPIGHRVMVPGTSTDNTAVRKAEIGRGRAKKESQNDVSEDVQAVSSGRATRARRRAPVKA